MKVNLYPYSFIHKPAFTSNARAYLNDDNEYVGTMTFAFRNDLDWNKLADCIVHNFKNKDKVNMVQFASSDGSEAYSLIISLLERCPRQIVHKFLPIKAYDIDSEIIRAAKSGYINFTKTDIENIEKHTNGNATKYFQKTNTPLIIANDFIYESSPNSTGDFAYKTYKAEKELTDNVHFYNKDMQDVLNNLEDNSNTVLMCRNVLGYFDEGSANYFVRKVSEKLKPGSLFVIGEFDCDSHTALSQYIEEKGFFEILPYIYQKLD